MGLAVDKCPAIHRGVLAGSYPPEQRCGAPINAATKTSMHSLAVVQKACKMLGIAKERTWNKKNLIIMVLPETLPPLSECRTCFFGLSAFSIKAWQRMCLKNIAKSKLESQYETNKQNPLH